MTTIAEFINLTATWLGTRVGAPLLARLAGAPTSGASLVSLAANAQGCVKIDAIATDFRAHTPSSTPFAEGPCAFIWVTTDGATVTGTTQWGRNITTPALPNKQPVPLSFSRITAVSSGSVYVGWYQR